MKTKVITICGSSRFVDIMAVCAWLLEREEKAITMSLHLLPRWYFGNDIIKDHLAEHEDCADQMDELHLRKIDISDEIFVVDYNDYVGNSTGNEVHYANKNNKKIRWYTTDPIGKIVDDILSNSKK